MALRGTLKDFGIADIFQLIGHQAKNGKLSVKNRGQVVNIVFRDGNVVRAEPGSRERKDLLGAMLVRSEVVTEAQLRNALEKQKSTLKRLGQILIEDGVIDKDTLQIFTRLQTTEAIYRLFLWDSGTYEFEGMDVPPPADRTELLRSENVLMEGFRQVDEWPNIRRKITGYGLIFYKTEDLEALVSAESKSTATSDADPFGDLDAAFSDLGGGGGGSGRLKNIGDKERLVYALITPERDVQKISDLSRLGEFDTCKALCNLVDASIIHALPEGERRKPSAQATVGGITSGGRPWIRQGIRAVLVVAVMVVAYAGAQNLELELSLVWTQRVPEGHVRTDLQDVLSRSQMLRLEEALAVFRSQNGGYPPALQNLVEAGLVRQEDLSFPWRSAYHYRPRKDSFQLLRPLY